MKWKVQVGTGAVLEELVKCMDGRFLPSVPDDTRFLRQAGAGIAMAVHLHIVSVGLTSEPG